VIKNSNNRQLSVLGGIAALVMSCGAKAMEAPSVYPMGIANFGVAVVPPPGFYMVESLGHVELESVRNNSGDPVPAIRNFSTKLEILSTRVNWVPGTVLLGGRLLFAAVLPIAHIDSTRTAGAVTVAGRKSGTLDLTVNAGLAYDLTSNLKGVLGLSIYAPTGTYSIHDPVNLGKNHWAIEPMGALSYVNRVGLNADVTGGLIFNAKNRASGYTSGTELHFDYALGWAFGNGLTVGLAGFYWKQIDDDRSRIGTIRNNRAEVLAVGPVVKYDSGRGWNLSAQYEKMVTVKNNAKGDIVWLKVGFKL
jgi:hypothetical protein